MDKKRINRLILKIIMVALCVAMSVISYIFLFHLPKYILVIIVALLASMGVSIACVNDLKHEAIFKALLTAIVGAAIILAVYIILDLTGVLDKITSFEVLKQFVLDTKQWGIIVFILLTVFQVVVLPIPSMVTVLIGVAIYGALPSFILSTIGTIIGSLIAFLLGKIFGKKLVTWMVGKEKTDKYAELLNEKGRFAFILMMLFPCFPDDMLCLVAGISSMSYKYFITVICLTRPIMIAFYSFFGSGSIIPFSGWGIPVWIALFCLAFVAFLLLNKLKKHLFTKRKRDRSVCRADIEAAKMQSMQDGESDSRDAED